MLRENTFLGVNPTSTHRQTHIFCQSYLLQTIMSNTSASPQPTNSPPSALSPTTLLLAANHLTINFPDLHLPRDDQQHQQFVHDTEMDDINAEMDDFIEEHSYPTSTAATVAGEGANKTQAPTLATATAHSLAQADPSAQETSRTHSAGDHRLFCCFHIAPKFDVDATRTSDSNMVKLCMKTRHMLLFLADPCSLSTLE